MTTTAKTPKHLIIEIGSYGNSKTPCVWLHDVWAGTGKYVFKSDENYKDEVRAEVDAYRENGYLIFNKTNIKLNSR